MESTDKSALHIESCKQWQRQATKSGTENLICAYTISEGFSWVTNNEVTATNWQYNGKNTKNK